MSKEMDMEASESIISMASKFMIASVILVAVGAISCIYAALVYLVYGTSTIPFGSSSILVSSIATLFGLIIGAAFIVIGGFLALWGLFWMRSEGKRLKGKVDKVVEHVYSRLDWYATRFIYVSIVGVVVGVIAIVYAVLTYFSTSSFSLSLTSAWQNIFVFLGIFIGIGALAASAVLLVWGMFWRRRVENRRIF
jgi:hypothetical protein